MEGTQGGLGVLPVLAEGSDHANVAGHLRIDRGWIFQEEVTPVLPVLAEPTGRDHGRIRQMRTGTKEGNAGSAGFGDQSALTVGESRRGEG
jgi:hypothetical protein